MAPHLQFLSLSLALLFSVARADPTHYAILDPLLEDPWRHEPTLTPLLRAAIQQSSPGQPLADLLGHVAPRFPDIFIADLQEQDPQSADYYIDLSDIDLSGAHFTAVSLTSVSMTRVIAPQGSWQRVNLLASDLSGCDLRGATLVDTDLSGSDLADCDLRGATFTRVVLEGVILDRTLWLDGHRCAVGSIGVCR